MIKRINGTWLEFHHLGLPEGKYFNPMTHEFSEEQWRAKVQEIAELKMKYIVLMETANVDHVNHYDECYYDSKYYKKTEMIKCNNPIEVLLDECDKLGIKVFVSVGFYSNWWNTFDNMTNDEAFKKAFLAMDELHEIYGHHKSFYGWYFPDESEISYHFDEEFITYVNRYSKKVRSLNPNYKTLIAPYGTCKLSADDEYVEQLKRLDVDFVAYQDEVGVKKTTEDKTAAFYAALKKAHDKANRSKLWADVEVFTFEGDVYKSALLPANIERLKKQLEAVSPYVEEILIFEYQGMFNKPGTIAFCGHPDSIEYYKDYKKLLEEIEK